MRRTPKLQEAVQKSIECNCIICFATRLNLESAERNWRACEKTYGGRAAIYFRGLYRVNWKAAVASLMVLVDHPEKHLKGAPDATYKTTSLLEKRD